MRVSLTTRALVALAAVIVAAAGCRLSTQDPRDKDRLLEKTYQFVDLMVAGDVDGLMAFYPDALDPVVYNVDGDPVVGKEAIRAAWEDFYERFEVASFETCGVKVRVSGELGTTYGLWAMKAKLKATGTDVDVTGGRFTTIWGKRDGDWYVLHDHISTPLPLVTPAAGEGEAATGD